MAEEGWVDNEIARLTVKEYLKDIKNVDKLILGCTHYPLFLKLIKQELDENTEIINTGVIMAKYLKEYLEQNNLQSNKKNGNYITYITDLDCKFEKIVKNFIEKDIKLKKIEI